MIGRGLNFNSVFFIVVSVLVGGAVLAGFFFGINDLVLLLSTWTGIIVTFALLLGLANLVRSHVSRILAQSEGWPYSAVLVLSAATVIIIGLVGNWTAGDPNVQWIFQWLYLPVAASLSALLVFFVASAALRALRAGPNAAWVMLAVALVVLLGSAPWSRSGPLEILGQVTDWLIGNPVMAVLRGISLGAALGATATSLRVILGMDRPSA